MPMVFRSKSRDKSPAAVRTTQMAKLSFICVANAFRTPSPSFLPAFAASRVLIPAVQPKANCRMRKLIDPVSFTPATS